MITGHFRSSPVLGEFQKTATGPGCSYPNLGLKTGLDRTFKC